jgi:hypothetical protein
MRRTHDADAEVVFQPEELVRRETKAVNFLRALFIAVLVVVGAILSFGSYKLETRSEEETYQREFNAIATRLTNDFKNTITQVMWSANVIGASISSSSDLVNAAPNITIPNFDQLVTGAMYTSRVPLVFWSPLINNETQRKEWEAYADQQLNSTSANAKICFACGSSNLTVGFIDKKIVFPTGTYTCGESLSYLLQIFYKVVAC